MDGRLGRLTIGRSFDHPETECGDDHVNEVAKKNRELAVKAKELFSQGG